MSFQIRRLDTRRPRHAFPWGKAALWILSASKPVLALYRSWKKRKIEHMRRLLLKRLFLVCLAVLCSLLLLAGTVKALIELQIINLSTVMNATGAELPRDASGFTNILLLGQGDDSHDGIDLTDTIIVASIDAAKTKSVTLLSLPRDTYLLSTENMGKGRINSLYRDYKGYLRAKGVPEAQASEEAMRELMKEISAVVNLPIHGVVKVDFIGFEQAVDAIGGIDVVVPEDIVDNEYPDEAYGFEPFAISAGPQHLDGATALKYARSRHTTSDFDRSARQQQIIIAMGEKAKSSGLIKKPQKIVEMLSIFSENVEMTFTVRELLSLANLGASLSTENVVSMQLSDRNGLFGSFAEPGGFLYSPPRDLFEGASVLLPVSIPEYPVTWRQVRLLGDLLFRNRELFLRRPSIAVLNSGAKSGTAGKLASELTRYGFNVTETANAKGIGKLETSLIAVRGEEDRNVGAFLSETLKIPAGTLPVELTDQSDRITIVLGKDYVFAPLQDLLPSE